MISMMLVEHLDGISRIDTTRLLRQLNKLG